MEMDIIKAIIGTTLIAALLALSGCSGEIYIGTRQIDEVQQTQVMKEKSWLERMGVKSPARFESRQGS